MSHLRLANDLFVFLPSRGNAANKQISKKEFDEEAKDAFKLDGTPMTKAEKQWEDAVEQIKHYAEAPRVEALRQGTTLHKVIMQFKGWELAKMEEI